MAETATEPAPDAMQDVVVTSPVAVPIPEEPEELSETLYIQNFNEKIKIDGEWFLPHEFGETDRKSVV